MSEPNPQQLQRHKGTVRDTLQGLLDTVSQVPGLIHDSSSKELGAVISATAIREGAYTKTQEGLAALPAELSAFDQVLDDVLARSHDISQALTTLRTFNSRPAAGPPAAAAAPAPAAAAAQRSTSTLKQQRRQQQAKS